MFCCEKEPDNPSRAARFCLGTDTTVPAAAFFSAAISVRCHLVSHYRNKRLRGINSFRTSPRLLLYELVALPLWFKRPNPVIFVPCGFAAVLAYLLYIDLAVHGGWFLKFAFPVVGAYGLLVTAVVTLLKYVRRGHLYIFGGALIAHGIYMTFLEMMINIAFSEKTVLQLNWSYFPLFGCFILGMGLIIIAINKPMQESLKKKFFV